MKGPLVLGTHQHVRASELLEEADCWEQAGARAVTA